MYYIAYDPRVLIVYGFSAQTKEVAAGSGCKQRMALYNNGAAPKETNRACQTYTPPSGDVNVMLNSARLANLATDYHQTLLLNNADNQTDVNYVEELTGQKLILEGLMKERDDLLALKNRMEFLRNNNNLKMKEVSSLVVITSQSYTLLYIFLRDI